MDLTFQVPLQYCSLKHQILLSPPDTSTTECHFCFGPAASFFLGLLVIALCSSPVAYCIPTNLGGSASSVISFAFLYCSWGSCGKNTEVVCHSLLQLTVLSEHSTMTHLSWEALHGMTYKFIELDKAVVPVIRYKCQGLRYAHLTG